MIKEAREKEPFIHFGFNRQRLKVYIGKPVILYQDTIYKISEITEPFVQAPSAFVRKQSVNKYVLEFTTLGVKNCDFTTSVRGGKVLKSNGVTVEVVAITWGSKDIFFNNENITFNNL